MKPYNNAESGIDGYEDGDDWIRVNFKHGGTYEYRSPTVAANHIEQMKQLAASQDGLGTYINTHRAEVYSRAVKIS